MIVEKKYLPVIWCITIKFLEVFVTLPCFANVILSLVYEFTHLFKDNLSYMSNVIFYFGTSFKFSYQEVW